MSDSNTAQAVRSLGIAFLFAGAGYALPASLAKSGERAPEVMNLFCLVAWMGLAHFSFAYRGHLRAVTRGRRPLIYPVVFVLSLTLLFTLRPLISAAIFSAVAWVYFISHMVRGEMYFAGHRDWESYIFPLFAFVYFSFAMLAPDNAVNDFGLFLGAALALSPMLRLRERAFSSPLFLLSMFLIGETLVWGKYRPYMSDFFRDGVYTMHVAILSIYHYARSYFHMLGRDPASIGQILIVNLLSILAGVAVNRWAGSSLLIFLFGPAYFTVWVWLHQWMSDVFNSGCLKLRQAR